MSSAIGIHRRRAKPVVAIDGPAGAGKSTVARRLAEQLGYTLVDTGALYRGVALAAKERNIAWNDAERIGTMIQELSLCFKSGVNGIPRLLINGRDRSKEIRNEEISMGASDVSKLHEVRAALLHLQRSLGSDGGVILEGRDIGTVVFPDAEVKIFLTADVKTRAKRRFQELKETQSNIKFESVLIGLRNRDEQDKNRTIAPLCAAPDAVIVDTTQMSIDTAVYRIIKIVREASTGTG